MSKRPSSRDLETLSAYLDGELTQAETKRLESRLESDPGLRAALDALLRTRALLRRTPRRRAPRNFTLSPRQVASNPPMPPLYSVFRLASALATVLLLFTFAAHLLIPPAAATAPTLAYRVGGAPEEGLPAQEAAPSPTETAALPLAPVPPAEAEATGKEQPEMAEAESLAEPTAPAPTPSPAPQAAKAAPQKPPTPTPVFTPSQPTPSPTNPWKIALFALAALALLFGLAALTVRGVTFYRWQKKIEKTR
ncbi:MAG: hypothetical protein D6770_05160 [Anaerolineae bacterium]|nr:MAG: hypothetical protein D6770_05160 [Anaerolineae bacterium]